MICKIGDFNVSEETSVDTLMKTEEGRGSLPYMAPEILSPGSKSIRFTQMTDVYSFGIIMAYTWNGGERPYRRSIPNIIDIPMKVINGARPEINTECPQEIHRLMERCWAGEPGKRLTSSEAEAELEMIGKSMYNI